MLNSGPADSQPTLVTREDPSGHISSLLHQGRNSAFVNNRSDFQTQSIARFGGGNGFTPGDAFKWHSPGAHSSLPVTESVGRMGRRT